MKTMPRFWHLKSARKLMVIVVLMTFVTSAIAPFSPPCLAKLVLNRGVD